GANKKDYHLKNVCIERDFTVSRFADLYHAREGGICQKCSSKLQSFHGIEVGHIFKLGKKYTRAFNTGVLDQKGASITPVMGCYGIGVDRTVAAVIEQNHDQNGIIWPPALAPFQINILSLNIKNENVKNTSSDIYNKLTRAGYDVLWDDRDERPGFKFKDADLIGIPVQIIIGQRSLQNGKVEVKRRCDNQKKEVELKDIPGEVKDLVKTL
ncbi:MAG TPA: His/Gly/Thr/Pro-type tRNA ligase C-terminal domain-containing protein, partial [Spirochaetota bacterium]|nr:His/Gly/Thr/Pro-type tRNA ligase C-terminal domain-containing protein [Spirochaetota bacterium]